MPIVRAVLGVTLPGDDEVAVGVEGHRGKALGVRCVADDLELGGLGDAGGGEAAGEDATVRAVLGVALPRDDEVAVGVERHGESVLLVRGVARDLELGGKGRPGGGEAAGEDAKVRAVLAVALPGDDEVAIGVEGHGESVLVVRGIARDLELGSKRDAGGGEAAGEAAVVRTVLAVARPGDDEVAVGVEGHRGKVLVIRGVAVDLELDAQPDRLRGEPRGPERDCEHERKAGERE